MIPKAVISVNFRILCFGKWYVIGEESFDADDAVVSSLPSAINKKR